MMAYRTCSVQVLSGCSADAHEAPGFLTKCVLDIDIYKNRPSVHEHVKLPNPEVRSEKCEAQPLRDLRGKIGPKKVIMIAVSTARSNSKLLTTRGSWFQCPNYNTSRYPKSSHFLVRPSLLHTPCQIPWYPFTV